jgi:hypothetical protein
MGNRRVHTEFWWRDLRERDHLEHLDIDGRIILKIDPQEVGWGGMAWIYLAQDRERRRDLVNMAMNLRFP